MHWLHKAVVAFASMALMSVAPYSAAQQYPTRPVSIVVAYAPGGGNDIAARLITKAISPKLGQQVIVDNKPGAGGQIGTAYAAAAAPDGYTLMLGTWSTHTSNPALYPKSIKFDPIKDFEPIARLCSTPFTLDVKKDMTARTANELIAEARKNPGKLNYGSFGPGSSNHLVTEFFKLKTGVDIVHIPYKGAAPAITDLLGGSIDLMFGTPSTTVGHLKAGRFRTLAVTSSRRLPIMPDVPTMAEAGIPDFVIGSWFGVFAPKGTPRQIIQRLENVILAAAKEPEVMQRLDDLGFEPIGEGSDAFKSFLERDVKQWKDFIQKNRLSLEDK